MQSKLGTMNLDFKYLLIKYLDIKINVDYLLCIATVPGFKEF